jgi:hypothetical protein
MKYTQIAPKNTAEKKERIMKEWQREASALQPGVILEVTTLYDDDFAQEKDKTA